MIFPDYSKFAELAELYKIVPLYQEILVDMETPISIFKKVANDKENAFLLESVEGGENIARYSFIGMDPFMTFSIKNGKGQIKRENNVEEISGSPLVILKNLMDKYKGPEIDDLPRFYGGAVGYFGYDIVRYFENLPETAKDDLDVPDCYFVFPKIILAFDHVKHQLKVIANIPIDDEDAKVVYQYGIELIQRVVKTIQDTITNGQRKIEVNKEPKVTSNMTKEEFMGIVEKAKEYIKAGDIFQVVLSQRFKVPLTTHPFDVYRSLRIINPAPYLFYLQFGENIIIGSSPEMLVRVEDREVQTMPIAGTRPRGKNRQEDLRYEEELKGDAKEKAEHLMLVDLGRNDIGRVSKFGTVKLNAFMEVERYSHVMHLVSNVRGELADDKTCYDALMGCFPAGTVSGAPKIRAMEIIEELEPQRRGVYAGAIGYFGFTGNMDTCITIRTLLINKNNVYIQAGAGIVADSDPLMEYEETRNKARALLKTLNIQEE